MCVLTTKHGLHMTKKSYLHVYNTLNHHIMYEWISHTIILYCSYRKIRKLNFYLLNFRWSPWNWSVRYISLDCMMIRLPWIATKIHCWRPGKNTDDGGDGVVSKNMYRNDKNNIMKNENNKKNKKQTQYFDPKIVK